MNEFTARYNDQLNGVITGFDRPVFRGSLALNHETGMKGYLWANGIAWKDDSRGVEGQRRRNNLLHRAR
jgi:hypothetical protein